MAEEKKTASAAELRAVCPGASAEFILAQIESGATVEDAKTAFITVQEARYAAMEKRQADSQAALDEAKENAEALAKSPGVDAVNTGPGKGKATAGSFEGGAEGAYMAEIERLKATGLTQAVAASRIAAKNPELREAYVLEYNENLKR